jgi:hypothetical protein
MYGTYLDAGLNEKKTVRKKRRNQLGKLEHGCGV